MNEIQREMTIQNKLGLHIRAASKLVDVASQYPGEIYIIKENKKIDAKSIMAVMTLAATKGTKLTFIAKGDHAEATLKALETLMDNKFGEEE